MGSLFGPVMLVWFATLGVLGLAQIVQNPGVLAALNPGYALGLFGHAGWQAFVALGAVVLAVTGAEALYADMGHFGRARSASPGSAWSCPASCSTISARVPWSCASPRRSSTRSTTWCPGWGLWPLIGLATCATIIASQAVISGVFSLTRQAVQLGYLPRMTVQHTSATEIGQIYLPRVNWLLMVGVLPLVRELRLLGQPRRRLRHLGHRRHGDRRRPGRPGRRLALGLGTGRGAGLRRSSWSSISATSPPTRSRSPSGGWFPLARISHKL